ncbi:MAG: hypothetical protein KKI12_01455 [Proteobacteria bacterium]|nr:hypothetical protein [Pseudomonadota bacterium]MCG2756857.1 hypothetical protein [Desulfobacteraceae bacterium]MCG2831282.1 hypothetical protein [Desulfobacteraceae bacterium]
MKLDCIAIIDPDVKKSVEALIIDEWENGILYVYKKKYPNANVVVSLPNKAVDYWCNIFNENGDLIGRFSITGDRVIVSNVVKTGKIETT